MLNRLSLFILLLALEVTSCVPAGYSTTGASAATGKTLSYSDQIYENSIRTVQLISRGQLEQPALNIPVIPLGGRTSLQLSFDDLNEEAVYYMVRIEYLNADWTPSRLPSMDYLSEYNEFRISDIELSLNTKVPYVHYRFTLPRVKVSGNYLAVVYREGNPEDIILTRRFVVFEPGANIELPEQLQAMTSFTGHRVDFNVTYNSNLVQDPFMYLRAVVRQNNRWDNAAYDMRPTQVREDENQVRFQYFDETNRFEPWNEFRFFDMRSVISPGQFITGIDREADTVAVEVMRDPSRNGIAYTFYRDRNGGFLIQNFDGGNADYTAEYVKVNLELNAPEILPGEEVYVTGQFSNYQMSPAYRLERGEGNVFKAELLLKQGYYDYMYAVKSDSKPPWFLEGSHINTENLYDIFIYHLDPVERHQRCIGYFQFGLNERNR